MCVTSVEFVEKDQSERERERERARLMSETSGAPLCYITTLANNIQQGHYGFQWKTKHKPISVLGLRFSGGHGCGCDSNSGKIHKAATC